MTKKMLWIFFVFPLFHFSLFAEEKKFDLEKSYSQELKTNQDYLSLKEKTLKSAGVAVPTLINVMKDKKYPDKNRWLACFMIGKIMGVKSSDFLSKFLHHDDWILRLAALKTLLHLKEKRFGEIYARKLSDSSYFVRLQALENLRLLNLKEYSPQIWNMLFDSKNYKTVNGRLKRSSVISKAIHSLGELKYQKAYPLFLQMVQKENYKDLLPELNFSLSSLSGVKLPKEADNFAQAKKFWRNEALKKSSL